MRVRRYQMLLQMPLHPSLERLQQGRLAPRCRRRRAIRTLPELELGPALVLALALALDQALE